MAANPSNRKRSGSGDEVRTPSTGSGRFLIVIGGLVIVGIAVLYQLTRGGRKDLSIPVNVQIAPTDTAGFRGYLLGSDTAKVEITEYADYTCPACAGFDVVQFATIKKQLIDAGVVRWRYRDYVLADTGPHRHGRIAAHAAACMNDQGKFWEYKALLFERQQEWVFKQSVLSSLRDLAVDVGGNADQFDDCMESTKHAARIQASTSEAIAAGARFTPSFVIGKRIYSGILSSDSLAKLARSAMTDTATANSKADTTK